MNIYLAINKSKSGGDWLERHDRRRHVVDTDWWHKPTAKTFRQASKGDLFFVKRAYPNPEIFVCARFKNDYMAVPAKEAWRYTSEAYSMDSTYQKRAADVLKIPEEGVTPESLIGLILLEDMVWFPAENRPRIDIDKYTVTGRKYEQSDPEYEIFARMSPRHVNLTAEGAAICNSYTRCTEAQCVEILLRHTKLADGFEKWLTHEGFEEVKREQGGIDLRFRRGNHTYMAELKICYGLNTRQAIREALGQVLEYNHYPGRMPAEEWWIILDRQPSSEDGAYIAQLRRQHLVPLRLGYENSPDTGEFRLLNNPE